MELKTKLKLQLRGPRTESVVAFLGQNQERFGCRITNQRIITNPTSVLIELDGCDDITTRIVWLVTKRFYLPARITGIGLRERDDGIIEEFERTIFDNFKK